MKSSLIAIGLSVALGSAAVAHADDIKDGPGKDVFVAKCTACHAIQDVLVHRYNRETWERQIRYMVSLGADLSEDDIKVTADYLSKNYGPG